MRAPPLPTLLLLLLAVGTVAADALAELAREKTPELAQFAALPALVAAVAAQNAERLGLDEIRRRDQEWREGPADAPRKRAQQDNAPGRILKALVQKNRALYSEAFLTDAQGANVAAYPPTSDYWQGDEAKFIEAYAGGTGRVYYGPTEYDESSATIATQVALPVRDGTGRAIGVLVVGLRQSYAKTRGEP